MNEEIKAIIASLTTAENLSQIEQLTNYITTLESGQASEGDSDYKEKYEALQMEFVNRFMGASQEQTQTTQTQTTSNTENEDNVTMDDILVTDKGDEE